MNSGQGYDFKVGEPGCDQSLDTVKVQITIPIRKDAQWLINDKLVKFTQKDMAYMKEKRITISFEDEELKVYEKLTEFCKEQNIPIQTLAKELLEDFAVQYNLIKETELEPVKSIKVNQKK